jgi:hypothetical protein
VTENPLAWNETRIQMLMNNDVTLTFSIIDPNNDNAPVDLTGATVTFYRKASRWVSDSTGISYTGDVQSPAANGVAVITVPNQDNESAGTEWWHLDVELNSLNRTAGYGPLEVIPL